VRKKFTTVQLHEVFHGNRASIFESIPDEIQESIDPIGVVGPKTHERSVEVSQQKTKENPIASAAPTSVPKSTSSASTSLVIITPEIVGAVLATDLADNGSALASVTSFASTTQDIYAVLSLKKCAAGSGALSF
jgi:hypothetical protein